MSTRPKGPPEATQTIYIRCPESVKKSVEDVRRRDNLVSGKNVSLNEWCVKALRRAARKAASEQEGGVG